MPDSGDNKASPFKKMHDENRHRVLVAILSGERVTRQDIRSRTGLTDATVSRITREFINAGLVIEGDKLNERQGKGRRRVEVKVNPDSGYIVAVCLSAFERSVSILDLRRERRWLEYIPTKEMVSAKHAVNFIGQAVNRYLAATRTARKRILGAGVVVAGSVNRTEGRIVHAPLLKWDDFPLMERLRSRLGCRVAVSNVAEGLCLAGLDLFQPPTDGRHMFLVHVAVGMGATLMIDGRLVHRRGDEAWISRVPVMTRDAAGGVGRRLGERASGQAILSALARCAPMAVEAKNEITHLLESAVRMANEGDRCAVRCFRQAGETLGRSLGLVTAAFHPDSLILAGPVVHAAPYREAAEAAYRRVTKGLDDEEAEIVVNQTTYLEAAASLGVREFMVSGLLSRATHPRRST